MVRERGHAALLTVDEKSSFRARLSLPVQQFGLIGMGRKPVNRADTRPDRNVVAEDSHLLGAIDDPTCESAAGSVSDEHDS